MNATPRAQATASANSDFRTREQAAQLGEVEQADRRRDDDGGQDRLRHRLDQAGHDEEHREHQSGGDEAGQLGLGARLGGDGGPRAARADREPREEARRPGWPIRSLRAPGCRRPRSPRAGRSRPRSRSCHRSRRARSPARRRTAAGCRPAARQAASGSGSPAGARRSRTPRAPRGRARSTARSRPTTAMRIPGVRGDTPHETQDDAEAQQADAEGPRVRLVEALDECSRLGDEPARVGARTRRAWAAGRRR